MIVQKEMKSMIDIDLTGPQGNVFFLIGQGVTFCKQLKLDEKEFMRKMMSSDYENSVRVFDEYFGHFVNLER